MFAEIITILFLWIRFGLPIKSKFSLIVPWPVKDNHTLITLLTFLTIFGIISFIDPFISNEARLKKKKKVVRFILDICLVIFIGFTTLFYFSSQWAMNYFGNLKFDQIIFTLSQPLNGSDNTHLIAYIKGPLVSSLFTMFWFLSIVYMLSIFKNIFFISGKLKIFANIFLIIAILLYGSVSFSLGIARLGYSDIKAYYFEKTEIYDKNYVDPRKVELVFPEKKRNLIYIFLESMESSYSSKDNGGVENINLIPNLTNYAFNEGTSFSNTDKMGGMLSIPGANQTVSSMFAQTSGVPLRTSGNLDVNVYGSKSNEFMPGAYSLGEILNNEGYNQTLFIGSEASFGGRDKYFINHGAYEIRDYFWIKNQGMIPEDYHVWWGVEDEKLFPFAKDSLTEIASKDEPFNFTMLTTDTHFEYGYATPQTPDLFNDQYRNVIHESDGQVAEFLEWIKQQPFYENTTVIVVGDHPTMDTSYNNSVSQDYERSVYNLILNAPTALENDTKNRIFNATDMFPTTLASLGVKIEGDRLGLGTNLFSSEETLMEKIGKDKYLNEINKKSDFYNKNIVKGTDYNVDIELSSEK